MSDKLGAVWLLRCKISFSGLAAEPNPKVDPSILVLVTVWDAAGSNCSQSACVAECFRPHRLWTKVKWERVGEDSKKSAAA